MRARKLAKTATFLVAIAVFAGLALVVQPVYSQSDTLGLIFPPYGDQPYKVRKINPQNNNWGVHGNRSYAGIESWLGTDFTGSSRKTIYAPFAGTARMGTDPDGGHWVSVAGEGDWQGWFARYVHLESSERATGHVGPGDVVGTESAGWGHTHLILLNCRDVNRRASGCQNVPILAITPSESWPHDFYVVGGYTEAYAPSGNAGFWLPGGAVAPAWEEGSWPGQGRPAPGVVPVGLGRIQAPFPKEDWCNWLNEPALAIVVGLVFLAWLVKLLVENRKLRKQQPEQAGGGSSPVTWILGTLGVVAMVVSLLYGFLLRPYILSFRAELGSVADLLGELQDVVEVIGIDLEQQLARVEEVETLLHRLDQVFLILAITGVGVVFLLLLLRPRHGRRRHLTRRYKGFWFLVGLGAWAATLAAVKLDRPDEAVWLLQRMTYLALGAWSAFILERYLCRFTRHLFGFRLERVTDWAVGVAAWTGVVYTWFWALALIAMVFFPVPVPVVSITPAPAIVRPVSDNAVTIIRLAVEQEPGCDPDLVYAIWATETNVVDCTPYRDAACPNPCCSSAGAKGPLQFMDGTWPTYADSGWDRLELYDSSRATCRMVGNRHLMGLKLQQEASRQEFQLNFTGLDGSLCWNCANRKGDAAWEQAGIVWDRWQGLKALKK